MIYLCQIKKRNEKLFLVGTCFGNMILRQAKVFLDHINTYTKMFLILFFYLTGVSHLFRTVDPCLQDRTNQSDLRGLLTFTFNARPFFTNGQKTTHTSTYWSIALVVKTS